MSDLAELALVVAAIESGVTGCCEWNANEANRIRGDRSLKGLTPEYLRRRLVEHVSHGGAVHRVKETRPQYSHRDFYYKVVIPEPQLGVTGRALR